MFYILLCFYLWIYGRLNKISYRIISILKRIFKKWDGEIWTGLIWMRIGTGGRLL